MTVQKIFHFLWRFSLFTFLHYNAVAGELPVDLKSDGVIRLYFYHTREFAEMRYRTPAGGWDNRAYQKILELFRSRDSGAKTQVDKKLIELLDHIQDHFGADTVEVISGYRSKEFNRELKETGHKVANESYHTQGQAADIHLDEIDEAIVAKYVRSLKRGGVGYYGNKLGPVNTNEEPQRSERRG